MRARLTDLLLMAEQILISNTDTINLTHQLKKWGQNQTTRPEFTFKSASNAAMWKQLERKTRWLEKDAEGIIATANTIGPPPEEARNRKCRGTSQEK